MKRDSFVFCENIMYRVFSVLNCNNVCLIVIVINIIYNKVKW